MAEEVKLDVLAIAAHPDDVEITCGGYMIKCAQAGQKTGVLDLTQGEMGTRGDKADRAREAAEAATAMGLAWRHNLRLPDSGVEYNQENKLKIAQVIRDTQPKVVLLPHWNQRHPDHLACSRLGYDACFLAGLKKAALEGEATRPRNVVYVSYTRNTDFSFLVDISEQFEQKLKAVSAYRSQFGDPTPIFEALQEGRNLQALTDEGKEIFHPGAGIFEFMQTHFRRLGMMAGVEYAEAFTVKEHILLDAPLDLKIRSI